MASSPTVPEAMEWQQEEGDELSLSSARNVESSHIQLFRSHSANQARRSPGLPSGLLAKH